MSTPNQTDFVSIEPDALETVAGAASKSDDTLTATLTQITSSIKDLANTKNQGMDPMQMMLMMLMMGGGGGGGVVAAPGVGVAAQPIINVGVRAGGGGCFRRGKGKKGW